MIIGVISDTHGLLRREAIDALRGADRILHAGDVGNPQILETLASIAPLTAIRGNVDTQPWARKLPETEFVEIVGVLIYMLHDLARLDLKPGAAQIGVVVYGHNHHPKMEVKNGVLYFNPGSAGPRRFRLPVSVGRLHLENRCIRGELVKLKIDR